jgi:hypothetical protein
VARCVCEKVTQSVAQSISCEKYCTAFTMEKSRPISYFCNFHKTTQSKLSPKRQKFGQSGHPIGHSRNKKNIF